jgi:hypothetical protein
MIKDKKKSKELGEVFTPTFLINDMLDTLPNDVWSNSNLKWLDPCAGHGNFPIIIVERLMQGLSEVIPDDVDRYNHIIKNMLYMVDIQADSCDIIREIYPDGNIFNLSFLDDNELGMFDLIIANPPYQTSNEGETKTHPIWQKFVQNSFEHLVEGGYLCMVHPGGWRNIDGKFKDTQKLLVSKQMLYLELHDTKDGVRTFGAHTSYDFYCIKNEPNNGYVTKIKCVDGTIEYADLSKMEFIPNGMFAEFEKLRAKDREEKVEVLGDSSYHTQRPHMSKEQTDEFKYPCAYTIMKNETKSWYSNTNKKGHFGIPKLIWGNGRIKSVGSHIDIDGENGLTQFAYAIIDEPQNLVKLKNVFDSIEFRTLMENGSIGDMSINRKIIATFRKDFWKEFLGDEKVEILHSYSAYEARKPHMSKEQTDEFIYPCVYLTYKDGSIKFMYSNTNEKGHFGVPKVIWSNGGASTPCVDIDGEYGMTEFAYAIVDEPQNLPLIQKAMLSDKFLTLMTFSDGVTGVGLHRYNRKAISTFRKDFWKEFLND